MRRILCVLVTVGVLAWSGLVCARMVDGFAGTAFGTSRAALATFMTLKKNGPIEYAVNLNESYRIDGHAPVVFYGFADGRLFAAYVRLEGAITRDAMAKRLRATFGKPSAFTEDGIEILRWRKGDLKIKLKFDPQTKALRLAYYSIAYGEAAAKVLAEPDSVDMDALARAYEKNNIAKGIKLPPLPAHKGYSPYDDGVTNPSGRRPGK